MENVDNIVTDREMYRLKDVIMLQKMHHTKNRTIDKIYYKVISRTKDKLVCEWANDDIVYTTLKKALKAPLPRVKELKN